MVAKRPCLPGTQPRRRRARPHGPPQRTHLERGGLARAQRSCVKLCRLMKLQQRGGRLRPSEIRAAIGAVVVSKIISPGAPSPSKPTFLRRHLARQISEYLSSSLNSHNLSESLQVKSKMTAASELQKDTQADGDVDKGPYTNMDVATDKTTSNVLSTSEAANVSAFEQAPSSLDVSQRDEGEAPGHGDAVVNEDIEGEGAARTTLQVVVSLTDMLVPRHDCCGAPVKTAICRC